MKLAPSRIRILNSVITDMDPKITDTDPNTVRDPVPDPY
jgi:hypothetical protein